jgi:hypothetical protein
MGHGWWNSYTRTRITRARKLSPKPYTISASSRFVPRMTHSLLDPAVMPENGEVNALEASSIALCTELSRPEEEFAGLAPVVAVAVGGAPPFRSPC